MSARDLKAALARYCGRFALEKATVDRFIALLETSPAPFQRENFVPGHCTGSAWIVDESRANVLLAHHKKLKKWLQLGGHADGDSNLMRVALREAQEESGLRTFKIPKPDIFDIDIHEIPAHKNEPAHLHYDVRYLLIGDSSQVPVCSDESLAVQWVKMTRIESLTREASILRMLYKTKSK